MIISLGFPGGSDGKESVYYTRRPGFKVSVRKIPWRREQLTSPLFLPGEFHGQKSLAVFSRLYMSLHGGVC